MAYSGKQYDFLPDRPGLETVVLDRIGPRDNTGIDANVLLSSTGGLIWRENPKPGSGWLTVTEKLSNWKGDGKDYIFSYRRTSEGPAIFEATSNNQNLVAEFQLMSGAQDFGMHANLCGDEKEEVVIYNENQALIYANEGCDIKKEMAPQPQNRRHYNWSIYTGWEDENYTFFTPGQIAAVEKYNQRITYKVQPHKGSLSFTNILPSTQISIWSIKGELLAESKPIQSGKWSWTPDFKQGVYLIQVTLNNQLSYRKVIIH